MLDGALIGRISPSDAVAVESLVRIGLGPLKTELFGFALGTMAVADMFWAKK